MAFLQYFLSNASGKFYGNSDGVCLILASKSPRRAALLRQLGLDFLQEDAVIDEGQTVVCDPVQMVCELAERKANAVQALHNRDREIILAADTVVCMDGKILGKPKSEQEACEMLRMLSGGTHQVYTGVCVRNLLDKRVEYECTNVTFIPLNEELILRYVQSGEARDKAGAYGIQGKAAVFVRRIEGCYYNVVGLPLYRTSQMLQDFGVYI